MRPQGKERKTKPSAMVKIQKSIDDNSELMEWFVFMVFKDGLPFWCEMEEGLVETQVGRLNKDAGFNRYSYKRVKVVSEI